MSTRELDVVIFGATGFTGKHTISILQKLITQYSPTLKWGVAGRSEKKLRDALAFAQQEMPTQDVDMSKIPLVIANVDDENSLNEMAKKTRILINCCGPYRFFGEPVVRACVTQGTHHVDVSGEPQFIEGMQLKYDQEAKEKGIYIVSACGLDSIPSDLGVVFLQEKFGGTLNSVETYLRIGGQKGASSGPAVNYGTWHSAVYGLAHADELRSLRRQLFPKRLPQFKPTLQKK